MVFEEALPLSSLPERRALAAESKKAWLAAEKCQVKVEWGASLGVPTSTLGLPLRQEDRQGSWELGRKPGWAKRDGPQSDLGLLKLSVLC